MSFLNQGNEPALAAANISCMVLTWIFADVRVYVRLHLVKTWGLEDWLFVASQFFFTAFAICALLGAEAGLGQRISTINSLAQLPTPMIYWFICELLQAITSGLMRLSLGFLLVRVCHGKIYLYTIYTTMGVMALSTVVVLFCTVFQCHPVEYFWLQFSGLKGACLPAQFVKNFSIASSVIVAIVDLIFKISPIFLLWNLKMNIRAKIIAGILLTVGIIAGATVFVRISFLSRVDLQEYFLFAISNIVIWSLIEPCIGICCLSIVTYRPLFKSLADKATTMATGGAKSKMQRSGSSSFYPSKMRSAGKSWQQISANNSSSADSFPLGAMNNSQVETDHDTNESRERMEGKGIYMNRTVEVTREERATDMV